MGSGIGARPVDECNRDLTALINSEGDCRQVAALGVPGKVKHYVFFMARIHLVT
jgi:hypothetical protein